MKNERNWTGREDRVHRAPPPHLDPPMVGNVDGKILAVADLHRHMSNILHFLSFQDILIKQ